MTKEKLWSGLQDDGDQVTREMILPAAHEKKK